MKKVELIVTLKPQVLDTQGEALNRAVHELDHDEINTSKVTLSKYKIPPNYRLGTRLTHAIRVKYRFVSCT